MMTVKTCDAVPDRRTTVSRWFQILVRILPAVLAIAGLAAAQASAQDAVRSFDIPAQSLPAALDAFAEQAHVQMLYTTDSVSNLQSTPVSGRLLPEQALDRLLQGTGLSFQSGGPNTITVVTPPAEPNHENTPPARDRPRTQKPVQVPEILVKDVQERAGDRSYVAEETNTATKGDIPLIETPQSISVITRTRMQAQEVNSLAEALRYSPGVLAESNGFDGRLTWLKIRGFESSTDALFKDGLQLRNPAFALTYNFEPYGAEQLDLLRGPASFLYGAGSPGGLLNYISKRPTQQSIGEVQFLAGNFGRFEGRFDFGGRVNKDSDTLTFRLTGLFRESGTQVDHVPNDRVYIAPALTWRMSSRTSVTFFATYQKDRVGSLQWTPADGTLQFNPNGRIVPERFVGQPGVDRYDRREHSVGYEFQHQFNDDWKFLQKMRYNVNETDFVTTYVFGMDVDRRTAFRDQWTSFGKLNAVAIDNQLSGRLSTGPFQHRLLAGLDFQRVVLRANMNFAEASSIDVFNRYDYGAIGVVPYSETNQQTTQFQTGAYIQDQIKYDKWLLTLGGRHDWTTNDSTNNIAATQAIQNDRKFTGRAALTYLFESGLAPYVSYSTFFLPSLGLDANNKQFKPETGRQYEAGIKYQIPRTRAFVTAAVFDLTRENYVQTDPGSFLPVQRGKVNSRGIELEAVATFDSGFDVTAALTVMDAEVKSTPNPQEEGRQLLNVPSQYASTWIHYTFPTGTLKGLGLGGGVRYIGYNYADTPNNFRVPSYVLGDAVIDYTWNHYRFALNISNITNQTTFACFSEGIICAFGERRTVVGSVAYRW